ncbi:TPA: P-II family nitrogen regulator [bacterium]|nr:P-II family nitrogen regulator [bacterium]
MPSYELICAVVNYGVASKVMKLTNRDGVVSSFASLATGTASNALLDILSISDIRKEVVFILVEKEYVQEILDEIITKVKIYKSNHGIVFTIPIVFPVNKQTLNKEKGGEDSMYNSIFIVVDKGQGASVMESANAAGAKGGTILSARGVAGGETSKIFEMEIEPEKEVVMIIASHDITDKIVEQVNKDLKLDAEGNGIIFVQSVNNVHGLKE